jgi:hypothetical protein
MRHDDYVFFLVSSNGVAYTDRELSHDTIQKYLSDLFAKAGFAGSFTTHYFRRGGAQYQFMFAPLGKRWLLTIMR